MAKMACTNNLRYVVRLRVSRLPHPTRLERPILSLIQQQLQSSCRDALAPEIIAGPIADEIMTVTLKA